MVLVCVFALEIEIDMMCGLIRGAGVVEGAEKGENASNSLWDPPQGLKLSDITRIHSERLTQIPDQHQFKNLSQMKSDLFLCDAHFSTMALETTNYVKKTLKCMCGIEIFQLIWAAPTDSNFWVSFPFLL